MSLHIDIIELPSDCQPILVVRKLGTVVVVVHVWADRHDVVRAMRAELTDDEFDGFAEALGWPAGMVPTAWLEEVGPLAVPERLWLPPPVPR